MLWLKQSEDYLMPDWLKSQLPDTCPECGAIIYNGYNKDNECTRRIDSNEQCPRVLAARIAYMCELMEVPGIKEGNSYKIVREHQLTNYFDAIPIIFKEKPKIHLSMLFRFAFIFGINDEFDLICKDYVTVDEVLNNYNGKYKKELSDKRELLKYGESKFEIIKPYKQDTTFSPVVGGVVVITGSIPGFEDRADFIPVVNSMFLGLTNFSYSPSKRKTGLFCCISQDKSITTGKVQDAKACGAPIYTKDEFMAEVMSRIKAAGYFEEYVKVFQERSVSS